MIESAIPASVLQRLPGWKDAEASLLTGGWNNQAWLLQKPGARAVLKYDRQLRSAPYNTRLDEARIQSAAAAAGLANPVLYVDERVLLSEYAEGEVWEPASLSDLQNLERLADALRRMHALPPTGRKFDAAAAAEIYARDIDGDRDLVAMCTDIAAAAGKPATGCCCHNDVVAENIIATPAVRFLDWEYACDNDPLFDLATIVEHHGLSGPCTEHLLDAYYEGDGDRWRSGLLEQQRLYQALLWLWLASRRSTRAADLQRAAERLVTSCS